ncbi:MAG: trypsin-like peptidase domain-containing protein [Deinococcales bacterium]
MKLLLPYALLLLSLLSYVNAQALTSPASPLENSELTQLIDDLGFDFAERRVMDVYEAVSPSVVSITTQSYVRDFFYVVPREGAGSGFIIDEEGHVVTNFHVIDSAEEVNVILANGVSLPAEIVGTAPRSDIALLKIKNASKEMLKAVVLGDSSQLKVGQRAIAIGNPFGEFGQTLTTGVVSALNRSLEADDGTEISGVIQTDAAINRGNSGGPLLDSAGRVIGINRAIFSPSGTNSGVGFAVPVDTLKRVLPDILAYGRYRSPSLGINRAYQINKRVSDLLRLPVEQGLLLVQLSRQSPLLDKGVRGAQREVIINNQSVFVDGDILISVDGTAIESPSDLSSLLENHYLVGDEVNVSLVRERRVFDVKVVLAEEQELGQLGR